MYTLREFLDKNIKKLIGELKSEEDLKAILKVKMTKKEFKIFNMLKDKENKKDILESLQIDEKRYDDLVTQTVKKINQEKLKQLLITK